MSVNTRKVVCEICKKEFTVILEGDIHVLRFDSSDKKLVCHECKDDQ